MPLENKEKPYTPSTKRKIYDFFNKALKILWWLFVLVVVIEMILIVAKFVADRPMERICFDRTNCFNYCDTFKGSMCIAPELRDTDDRDAAWRLLLTGKRTVLEVLNPNQGYCACSYITGDDKQHRIDTFYQFYSENK